MKLKQLGPNQTELAFADHTAIFISYETPVACFIPGVGHFRTEKSWSPTTSRHINKWLASAKAATRPQEYFDSLLSARVIRNPT